MSTFKLFADAGLTVPITGGKLQFAQPVFGAPHDRLVYFGSPATGKKLQTAVAPGTNPVQLSIVDSDEMGGLDPTALRLALSFAGLDSATPGAALTLGTTILSGVANAVPVFIRGDSGSATAATFNDLVLRVADVLPLDA